MESTHLLQGELDFWSGNNAGYERWQQEQEARLAEVRRDFGLPIGRQVRVKLRDFDRELTGRLGLVEFPLNSARGRPPLLRVSGVEFSSAEIDYCLRDD
jgi:hypothetical protein